MLLLLACIGIYLKITKIYPFSMLWCSLSTEVFLCCVFQGVVRGRSLRRAGPHWCTWERRVTSSRPARSSPPPDTSSHGEATCVIWGHVCHLRPCVSSEATCVIWGHVCHMRPRVSSEATCVIWGHVCHLRPCVSSEATCVIWGHVCHLFCG